MITRNTIVADADADARWRAWQARGAVADRRRTTHVRRLMAVIALALSVWLLVQLV